MGGAGGGWRGWAVDLKKKNGVERASSSNIMLTKKHIYFMLINESHYIHDRRFMIYNTFFKYIGVDEMRCKRS